MIRDLSGRAIRLGFFEPDGAEFEFGFERNRVGLAIGESVDAPLLIMRLPPMKGHEESPGTNAIVQFESGAGKPTARNKPHGIAVRQTKRLGVGRMGGNKRSRTDFVELGNVSRFGAGMPLTAEAAGIQDERKTRR